jgi:antitoxin component of RelBE/YafQ-DinJ toxin-antitoxin module
MNKTFVTKDTKEVLTLKISAQIKKQAKMLAAEKGIPLSRLFEQLITSTIKEHHVR